MLRAFVVNLLLLLATSYVAFWLLVPAVAFVAGFLVEPLQSIPIVLGLSALISGCLVAVVQVWRRSGRGGRRSEALAVAISALVPTAQLWSRGTPAFLALSAGLAAALGAVLTISLPLALQRAR
jgi:hypothetical protein